MDWTTLIEEMQAVADRHAEYLNNLPERSEPNDEVQGTEV